MCRRSWVVPQRFREMYPNDMPAMEKCRGGQQACGEKCKVSTQFKRSCSREVGGP